MDWHKFFRVSKGKNYPEPECKPEVTFKLEARMDEIEKSLKDVTVTSAEIAESCKQGALDSLKYEFLEVIGRENLFKHVDFDKVLKEITPALEKHLCSQEFIEGMVKDISWRKGDFIETKIDWNQLTPALTALVTKKLADQLFNKY